MGIFKSYKEDSEKDNASRLSAIVKNVNLIYKYAIDKNFVKYVEALDDKNADIVIKPLSFCLSCIEMMMKNDIDFNADNYFATIKYAEILYDKVFIYSENTPNIEMLKIIFLEFFEKGGVIAGHLFDAALFNTFADKFNYITLINSSLTKGKIDFCFKSLVKYGVSVREYYIDEIEYTYNLVNMVGSFCRYPEPKWDEIISQEIAKIRRMNGIYNIESSDIAKAENALEGAKKIMADGQDIIEKAYELTREMNVLVEKTRTEIPEICEKELMGLELRTKGLKDEVAKIIDVYAKEQKERMVFDRKELLRSVYQEAEAELNRLRSIANNISGTTALELNRVNQQAEEAVRKIDKLVKNDAEVKRILTHAAQDQEFINKVNTLQLLNDTNIEAMSRIVSEQSLKSAQPASQVVQVVKAEEVTEKSSTKPVQMEENEEIPVVNPFLDQSTPFKQRWKSVMERKNKLALRGQHFHKMFDDVLMAVMEDSNPYLIGPSGCGKTYMIKQIAEILNANYIDIGYINEEYDILGFQTANGGYSRPNFYRCYKYGKIAFCDELDNGNSRATVKLNSFLSNSEDASYNFPNGENVKRHPNFRIVGAGNTAGNGADTNYNTREKIEESVQQRFTPIFVDYDNEVEKQILRNYPEWFNFVVLFREATDAWAADMMTDAPGILTTRDTERIRKYLDNGSFSAEKIIMYEFVQTKDLEYLLFLDDHIKRAFVQSKMKGLKAFPEEQVKLFSKLVEKIRMKGGRR